VTKRVTSADSGPTAAFLEKTKPFVNVSSSASLHADRDGYGSDSAARVKRPGRNGDKGEQQFAVVDVGKFGPRSNSEMLSIIKLSLGLMVSASAED